MKKIIFNFLYMYGSCFGMGWGKEALWWQLQAWWVWFLSQGMCKWGTGFPELFLFTQNPFDTVSVLLASLFTSVHCSSLETAQLLLFDFHTTDVQMPCIFQECSYITLLPDAFSSMQDFFFFLSFAALSGRDFPSLTLAQCPASEGTWECAFPEIQPCN